MSTALDTDLGLTPDAPPSRIASDSLFLIATSAFTAMVGVLFWILAARTIPPARLGIDTALISVITAAATAAATGVANAFIAMIPVSGHGRARLIRTGYAVVGAASAVTGLVAGVLVALALPSLGSRWLVITEVAAATIVWSLFVVQDPVLTATGRARWLLAENLPVNLSKLALLPVLALSVGHAAVLATVLPAAVAVAVVSGVVVPRLARADDSRASDDDEAGASWMRANRRPFTLFVLRDGAGSALSLALLMALPFLVTVIAGPVSGAVFSLCLQLSNGLDLVTAGIGVSLTTNVAADRPTAARIAMGVLRRVVVLVSAALLILVAASPLMLRLFGTTYVHRNGVAVIAVLGLGSLLRTTFEIWTALMRAMHRTSLLLVSNIACAAVLVPLVAVGAALGGALGAAVGMTVGTCAFSLVGAAGMIRAQRWTSC